MGSSITSISPLTMAKNWLVSETFPSIANKKNTSAPIKWLAKQSKANTISAATLFVHLLTYIPKFANNDDGFIVKGFRWLTGIVGLALPFLSLLPKPPESKSNLLDTKNDSPSKQKIIDSFLDLNQAVIYTHGKQSIFPHRTEIEYREKLYSALYEASKENGDPLYLNTPIDKVPEKYKEKAFKLREAIVDHFEGEVNYYYRVDNEGSQTIINTLENIIIDSSELSHALALKKLSRAIGQDPIKQYFAGQDHGYIWCSNDVDFKAKKYKAVEEVSQMEGDPLELQKPISDLSKEGKIIRNTLTLAYETEWLYIHTQDPKACPEGLESLRKILSRSTSEKEVWDVGFKRKEFSNWIREIDNGSNINAERIYDLLGATQLEYVQTIKTALDGNREKIETGATQKAIDELRIIDISRSKMSISDKKELALFFAILFSKVNDPNTISIGQDTRIQSDFKLREIVHDQNIFGDINRNLEFFKTPDLNSAPGYALNSIQKASNSQSKISSFSELNDLLLPDLTKSLAPGSKASQILLGCDSMSSVVFDYPNSIGDFFGVRQLFARHGGDLQKYAKEYSSGPIFIVILYQALEGQGLFPYETEALNKLKDLNGIILIRYDKLSKIDESDILPDGSSEKGNQIVTSSIHPDEIKGFRQVFTLQD